MGKYRTPSEKSKYYLSKEDYLTAVHYALRYPQWQGEYKALADTGQAIRYDRDKIQSSPKKDSLEIKAIKMAEISKKMELIDHIIHDVSKGMDDYIRLSVCYGMTYYQLKQRNIPCSRKMYSDIRRLFYYRLIEKI